MSSFVNNDAREDLIESPSFATTVSSLTNILPASIRVGILNALNALRSGPGCIPVLPDGTVISPDAISPSRAGRSTLPFSSSKNNLNGSISVNMNAFWSETLSTSFSKLSTLESVIPRLERVFFTTRIVRSFLKLFRSCINCAARTLWSLQKAVVLLDLIKSDISLIVSVFH